VFVLQENKIVPQVTVSKIVNLFIVVVFCCLVFELGANLLIPA